MLTVDELKDDIVDRLLADYDVDVDTDDEPEWLDDAAESMHDYGVDSVLTMKVGDFERYLRIAGYDVPEMV